MNHQNQFNNLAIPLISKVIGKTMIHLYPCLSLK